MCFKNLLFGVPSPAYTQHSVRAELPGHILFRLCHGTEICSILHFASIQNLIAIPLSFLDDTELQSRSFFVVTQ